MKFVIQNNLIKNQKPYIEALNHLNVDYLLIDFENIKSFLKNLSSKESFWFFGSVGMVKEIQKDPKIGNQISYNEENFLFSTLKDKYKDLLVNFDADICSLNDAVIIGMSKFIRPNKGLKIFQGSILNSDGLKQFKNEVKKNKFEFNLDELVVVASKKFIKKEYRVFIVDKKIVTGSQYMIEGKINLSEGLPEEIIVFVMKAINIWVPAENFVIDIAQMYNNELKIIEVNCIHSAGPYLANMNLLIKSILYTYDGERS